MKKRLLIEIEETVTEVRIVDPRDMACPAGGERISFPRPQAGRPHIGPSRIETIFIKPENVKALSPAKDQPRYKKGV